MAVQERPGTTNELLNQLLELANGDLSIVQDALRDAMERSGGAATLEDVVRLILDAVSNTEGPDTGNR